MKSFTVGTEEEKEDAGYQVECTLEETLDYGQRSREKGAIWTFLAGKEL